MKAGLFLLLGVILTMTDNQPAHVTNAFQFVVHSPMRQAATLFGPDGERCWAGPEWNPQFLYPEPGKDIQGAVFTVEHGSHKSVWVNTTFDATAGRMQYVSFIPDIVVSTVDVRLTPIDPSNTHVEVTYARTALNVAVNDHVEAMGKSDRESGAEWQQAIEKCLTAPR